MKARVTGKLSLPLFAVAFAGAFYLALALVSASSAVGASVCYYYLGPNSYKQYNLKSECSRYWTDSCASACPGGTDKNCIVPTNCNTLPASGTFVGYTTSKTPLASSTPAETSGNAASTGGSTSGATNTQGGLTGPFGSSGQGSSAQEAAAAEAEAAAKEAAKIEAEKKAAAKAAAAEAARIAAEKAAAEEAARKAEEYAAYQKELAAKAAAAEKAAAERAALEAERKAAAAKEAKEKAEAEERAAQVAAEEAAAEQEKAAQAAKEKAEQAVQATPKTPNASTIAAEEQSNAAKEVSGLRDLMARLKAKNQAVAAQFGNANGGNVGGANNLAYGAKGKGVARGKNKDGISVVTGETGRGTDLAAEQEENGGAESKKISRGLASVDPNRLRDGALGEGGDSGNNPASSLSDNLDKPASDSYNAYMSETARSQMVDELRHSQSARDELRKRIAGMLASGDPSAIAEAQTSLAGMLTEAEREQGGGGAYGEMRPLSSREAFSMDPEETSRGVKNLISEFDHGQADNGFARSESLFERVKSTHDRSLKNGLVKLRAQNKSK